MCAPGLCLYEYLMMMNRVPTFLAVLFVLAVVCGNSSLSAKESWISIRSKNSPGTAGFSGNLEVKQPTRQTPSDPSSELRAVLRKPAKGETQLQATLVRIDCYAKGIVFVIKTGDRVLRLKADKFEHVAITTYSSDVAGDITCGPRKPENAVIVCYIPSTETPANSNEAGAKTTRARSKTASSSTNINGLIRSLEFVPKDFKLKTVPGDK